ncbi:hypothetical protein KIN20_028165 [Parelaphostrongylus tenuis]|uniref:Uncharacterized protein n=1 Tax=Parelaphostrongylus tenuis TaxID=148309 RepID=A0AAD5R0M5_PARTN|nr:hypothetical protein KIN20_028165 [Parelaphostrongylus tenuis]
MLLIEINEEYSIWAGKGRGRVVVMLVAAQMVPNLTSNTLRQSTRNVLVNATTRENGVLPIGVFPGGYDNLSLRRLVPDVFESSRDVRRMCESAMALIEDERRNVNAFEFTVAFPRWGTRCIEAEITVPKGLVRALCALMKEYDEGAESDMKPIYSVGDVGAGWFRHIEEKRRKLWYLGPLKRRWAYLWEMVKRSPADMEAKLQYEEICPGCQTCHPPVLFEPPTWSKKDYSNIVNENCGQIHEVDLKGTDLIIENNQQEDTACLRVRMGGKDAGRYGVVADGWKRCSANRVGATDNEQFYSTDVLAKAISLTFVKIPEFIHRLYVSSDLVDEKLGGKKINVKSTDRQIEMYLPNAFRVDIDSL